MQKIKVNNCYINLIGIKDEGKKAVESINLLEFDPMIKEAYSYINGFDKRGFIVQRISETDEPCLENKSEWRKLIHIDKYYFDSSNARINNKKYASILVYDYKDIDYAKSIINDIKDDDTFVLIGLCINGSDKIEGINSINVSSKDIIDTIKQFMVIVMDLPGYIDFDLYTLNEFLGDNSLLKGFVVKGKSLEEIFDETKKLLEDRFKNKKVIDAFPFLMAYDYRLALSSDILHEVEKYKNNNEGHWLYAYRNTSNEDTLLIVTKE